MRVCRAWVGSSFSWMVANPTDDCVVAMTVMGAVVAFEPAAATLPGVEQPTTTAASKVTIQTDHR
ncbi:hypothetical protein CHT93_12035 [Staphylococcus epidermidis]|nr:hypothetical protein CHT93_12035 [Staphylococcus epidermidis]